MYVSSCYLWSEKHEQLLSMFCGQFIQNVNAIKIGEKNERPVNNCKRTMFKGEKTSNDPSLTYVLSGWNGIIKCLFFIVFVHLYWLYMSQSLAFDIFLFCCNPVLMVDVWCVWSLTWSLIWTGVLWKSFNSKDFLGFLITMM